MFRYNRSGNDDDDDDGEDYIPDDLRALRFNSRKDRRREYPTKLLDEIFQNITNA